MCERNIISNQTRIPDIPVLEDAYKAVGKPYNFSPGHWISIRFDSDMLDDIIESLVKKSYNLVSKKS